MLQTKQLGGASKRELPEQAHWSQKGQEHFESNEKASHTKSRSKGGGNGCFAITRTNYSNCLESKVTGNYPSKQKERTQGPHQHILHEEAKIPKT